MQGFTTNGPIFTGTPTRVGTVELTYVAQDAANNTETLDFTITVTEALALPTLSNQTFVARSAITPVQLPAAMDGTAPYTYTLTDRPDGLEFDDDTDARTLSGTPTTAGDRTVTYSVTDSATTPATTTGTFTITVNEALALPAPSAITVRIGANVSQSLPPATGGIMPYTYTLTGRPSWLTFTETSRTLSGTAPDTEEETVLTYSVTDSASTPDTATRTFTLFVSVTNPARRADGLASMTGAVGRALGWNMAGVIRNRARANRSGNHAPVAVSGVSGDATLDDLITRGASVDMALNANATAADDGGGANQVPAGRLWAKVGRSEFDNEPLNDYQQDGSLTSLHAGVDVQSGPDRLFGAAIGWHDARVDYDDREAEVEGDLELELLTFNPYASRTRDRWHAWGALGFGVGEMTYSETSRGGGEETSQSEVTLWNAVGGLEYTLDFIGASELTARGEGMFLSMDVDGTDNENLEFGPLRTDVYGARGEVEVGLPMTRDQGGTMRPFAVLGMRWEDGDDGAEGLSAELGGGITARSRDLFVDADLRARTGVDDEVGDALAWGLSLGFDVKNDNRGLAVELRHESGPQPWDPFADNELAAASDTSTDTEDTPATLGATTRYGLDYRNGRMTPYNTLRFDGGLLTEVETGIQYRLSDLSLGLKHVYEPDADPGDVDEHRLKLIGRITF